MERWYEHWLRKASESEQTGNNKRSIECLDKAEKHTFDPDELFHLKLWRDRLRESLQVKEE